MNTPPPTPPPPDPLAVALSRLDPAPHGFDWNALMFAAGRASKARALLFWRVATGVCALIAVGFAVAYLARQPVVVERPYPVYTERGAPGRAGAGGMGPVPAPLVPGSAEPLTPTAPAAIPEWNYDAPPERGAAARWLNTRNEVLSVGLGVLPDHGPKITAPPRGEK